MAGFSFNRVEVDLAALRTNYLTLCRLAGRKVRVMAIVKADAYGHGLVPAARALASVGARTFGVAEVEEGIALREAGISGQIVVLLGASPRWFPELLEFDLSPVVFETAAVRELSRQACRAGKQVGVHLKVDVGMGRFGILPAAAPAFLEEVAGLPGLVLAGLLSHLPMADHLQAAVTREQCSRFARLLTEVKIGRHPDLLAHLANSAGLLYWPESHFDMVRPGIALYGGQPTGCPEGEGAALHPVMSFKSQVVQVKEVPAGYGLSYGHTYTTQRPSRLAILPVGYDDGYLRRLSNRAEVLIRGRRVPLRGTICMNASVADVTEVPEVRVGDEVVLLGRQEHEQIAAEELAARLETINYEVLCLLGSRNSRIYLGGESGEKEQQHD